MAEMITIFEGWSKEASLKEMEGIHNVCGRYEWVLALLAKNFRRPAFPHSTTSGTLNQHFNTGW